MKNYKFLFLILFAGILGLVVWLRASGLHWGLPNIVHSNSYMADENNWVTIISQMEPSKLDFNPHYFDNPTFHFYLAGIGMKIAELLKYVSILTERGTLFTINYPEEYAKLFLVARFFSMVMGVMTVWLIYKVGRDFYGKIVGVTAALFLAVVPSHIIQCHYFNVNAPLTFWIMLSFWFMIKIMNTGKTRWYILVGITAGLAMSTKYTALLLIFPLATAHCLRENDKFRPKNIIISLFSTRLFMAYVFFALSFLMGSPYILFSWKEFINGILFVRQLGFKTSSQIVDLLKPIMVMRYGAGLPMSILSGIGLVLLAKRRHKGDILILSWIVPFYLISSRMVYYTTDSRLLPLFPFLCLCAALFLCKTTKFQQWGNYLMYIQIILVGAVFLYNLLFSLTINKRFLEQDVQDKAGNWILENIPAGTTIGYETSPYWWAPYIHYSPTDRSLLQRHKLIICEWDKAVLEKEKPAYFVATDLTFHEVSWGVNDWEKYQGFRQYLFQNYQLMKEFTIDWGSNWLKLSIETKPDNGPVMDIYYQPIYILKRI